MHRKGLAASLVALFFLCASAHADGFVGRVDSGDTAWMLIACAMVLFMTPGLAFFYGGMVRAKNVVSTLLQNYMAIAIVGLLWGSFGYSMAFSGDWNHFIGNLNWLFMNHVSQDPNPDYAPSVPHLLFMLYQCMCAIITPALITGAFAERVRFKGWLVVMSLWSMAVYVPVAHWVWSLEGWIHNMGAVDFAGGMVIHMTAGYAALVCALIFGKRKDFGKSEHRPYDTGMVLLGTGILTFGWLGLNAGAAMRANGLAAHALATTFFAGAAGFFMWTMMDWIFRGKPTAVGAGMGTIVGLVVISPAAGFVTIQAAVFMGLLGGGFCNLCCHYLKSKFHVDDTLDVFGCHGIGGTLGVLLTAVFASRDVNPSGPTGLLLGNTHFFMAELFSVFAIAAFTMMGTFLIIKAVSFVYSLRVDGREEDVGLDASQHSETINSNFTLQLVRGSKNKKVA